MAKALKSVLAMAALACMPALSQIAKEGPIDTTFCWGGPMHIVPATPNGRFGTYVVKGGTSAAESAFDSMILECAGAFDSLAGALQSRGYCVFEDGNGDRIVGVDSLTTQGGYDWEYVGGTGKFQGISGRGRMEQMGDLGPAPGTLRGCRRMVGSYKLP